MMRTHLALTGAATLLVSFTCPADFTGVYLEETGFEGGVVTYRLNAYFSAPTDQLLAINGTPDQPLEFAASAPLWNDGGGFTGLKEEDFAAFPISDPRDSWVTIGADSFVSNDTDYSAGFLGGDGVHAVIVGASFADSAGGWFDDDLGTPVTGTEILIAQLSFEGRQAAITLRGNVTWQPEGGALRTQPFELFLGAPLECPWDLDGTGTVGFADLLRLLSQWGPCGGDPCPADIDEDGVVGPADLADLMENWGFCPDK